MGYYTTFEFEIIRGNEEDILAYIEVEHRRGNEDFCYGLNENAKWYKHDEDMLALSKQFPNAILRLEGFGEESGDHWIAVYHNGETRCEQSHINEPDVSDW